MADEDKFISSITLPNNETYDIKDDKAARGNGRIFYGTCSTSAATYVKNVLCDNYDTLTMGDVLIVKFDYTNSATANDNLKLSITNAAGNTTPGVSIKKQRDNALANLTAVGEINTNTISIFVYNGTYWLLSNTDYYASNSDQCAGYVRQFQNASYMKPTTALYRYQILLPVGDGQHVIPANTQSNITAVTKTTITTATFSIVEPIEYYSVTPTVAAEDNIDGRYHWTMRSDINLSYSFNTGSTLTPYKDVYLVAIPVSPTTAQLRNPDAKEANASAQATGENAGPITQILPTEEDGFIYIKLGHAYSTSNIILTLDHPVYWFKDGELTLYSPTSLSILSGADDLKVIEALEDSATGFLKKTGTNTWTLDDSTYSVSTHNHDDAYVNVDGDTMTGNLTLSSSSGDSPAIIFDRGSSLTDWRIIVTGGKLSFQSRIGANAFTERGQFGDNSGAFTAASYNGLTLTKATTGFTIAGGTTSKTLTVNENTTLNAGAASKLAWYSAANTISGARNAYLIDESGTSVANKRNELVLGNATGKETNGSAFGRLALYSSGTAGTYLITAENSTKWYSATLQAKDGTIALTSDITVTSVTATGTAPLTLSASISSKAVTITGSIAAASSTSAGIIKIGTGASDALAGDTKYAGSDSAGDAANSVKITAHANSNASNNTNYYPWFSTTTSGGLSAQAYAPFYLHETVTSSKITKFDVCIGATNVTGTITLWDGSSHYGNISTTALNGNRTYALPNASGLLALLENGTAKGSDTKPVKVLDTGVIAECSLYAGGTAITLNNVSKSATSATIYAPTSNGTLGQVLKANGGTNAPSWEKEYSVEIIRMTT